MERRKFLQHAGIAGILAAGVAPAVHAQQTAIRWRLASSFPKALDTIYGAAETFSQHVKEMSGGKFEISVHAGGELMPAFGVLDGVQQGTVECAHTAPYYFFGKDPTFAMDCAIPFGLNSRSDDGLDVSGQRHEVVPRVLRQLQHRQLPDGQHRRADGRLVSQADQVAWPISTASRCASAVSVASFSRASAACRKTFPAAKSIRPWKRAPSTPPSGSAPTMTRNWASTRWPSTTPIRPGGKVARSLPCSSIPRRTKGCQPKTRPLSKLPLPMPTSTCRPSTMPRTRRH